MLVFILEHLLSHDPLLLKIRSGVSYNNLYDLESTDGHGWSDYADRTSFHVAMDVMFQKRSIIGLGSTLQFSPKFNCWNSISSK